MKEAGNLRLLRLRALAVEIEIEIEIEIIQRRARNYRQVILMQDLVEALAVQEFRGLLLQDVRAGARIALLVLEQQLLSSRARRWR